MRDVREHPVAQVIASIVLRYDDENQPVSYDVGDAGVTRIEAATKSGLHANMPYVRVWAGDVCRAEFCQHNIVGVYFGLGDAA